MILCVLKLRRQIVKVARIIVHISNFLKFGQENAQYRSVNMSFSLPCRSIRK